MEMPLSSSFQFVFILSYYFFELVAKVISKDSSKDREKLMTTETEFVSDKFKTTVGHLVEVNENMSKLGMSTTLEITADEKITASKGKRLF